ncbi:hypothetical protein QJS10_CPB11g00857 [Acorus calamus]|uniref:DUS-like FMN-binding domain-containing protein n=1 Tax=Acorus calamus TaxID=4465 RepID=A0AAV9DTH9_ACOCL|nr:hypothetical protein QJS10_CPB11g00857 [Acorus calamus]
MDYENKLVLAPMVRVVRDFSSSNASLPILGFYRVFLRTQGALPFRMLAAEYGADITYGEEIIDHKMLKCERVVNEYLGTTDFVEKGTGGVVFRTCPEERDRVVFQMGTSCAVRALATAQLVCKDVAAIDINMGCPKSFSISGGMGAALLSKPELIDDILTTLIRNLDMPVTCKIRLLKSPQDTVELARRIEKTGVSVLAVHGRKVADRPKDAAKWSEIADVVAALSIPVIANGDRGHVECFNFSPKGKLPWEEVKREYVRKCILWDNDVKSTKQTIKELIMHHSCLEFPEGKAVNKCETVADLGKLYGEEEYCIAVQESRS